MGKGGGGKGAVGGAGGWGGGGGGEEQDGERVVKVCCLYSHVLQYLFFFGLKYVLCCAFLWTSEYMCALV